MIAPLFWASPLSASSDPFTASLPALLGEALQNADAVSTTQTRLKFLRAKLGPDDIRFTAAFDPVAGSENHWTLVSPQAGTLSKDQEQSFAVLEKQTDADLEIVINTPTARRLLGEGATLYSETQIEAIFRAPIRGLPGSEKRSGPIDPTKIASHLLAEITVAKAPARITELRIFAPVAFKPIFAAEIATLDIRMSVEEAWDGGPWTIARVRRDITGDVFYVPFAEHVLLEYFEFAPAPEKHTRLTAPSKPGGGTP